MIKNFHINSYKYNDIVVKATLYDNGIPIRWGVYKDDNVMSKYTGTFDYEILPSSRTEDFFKEYRFFSAEEAIDCYYMFYKITVV